MKIQEWLHQRGIAFNVRHLALAETPLRFAERHGIPALAVVKTAFLRVDGRPWLVVMPADRAIAPERVRNALDANEVVELPMSEVRLYVHGQIDAACAFGARLGLPVLLDEPLTLNDEILVPTGEADLFLEMRLADYLELEQPNVEEIGTPITTPAPVGGETTEFVKDAPPNP